MTLPKLALVCALLCLPISTNAVAEWVQTLKRIDDSGEINLGYRVDQTPLSFDKGSGKAAGYSVELCQHIVAAVQQKLGRENLKVNYRVVTAESRFDAIVSGKVDILCGATTKTLSRMEIVGFTQPVFVTGGGLLSRNEAIVANLGGLEGKRVAVVSNTTTIVALNNALQESAIEATVVPVESVTEGMKLLEAKQIDALAADQVLLIGQVISRGGRKEYSLSEDLFSFEPFALAIPRGDPDFQLVADRVLSELNRSAEILRIYQKWFGSFGGKPPAALEALYQLNATPP